MSFLAKSTALACLRVLSVPSLLLSFLILHDLASPPFLTRDATVLEKIVDLRANPERYFLRTSGPGRDSQQVSWNLYRKAEKGDVLHLKLSRFLHEWKEVRLERSGAAVGPPETGLPGMRDYAALVLMLLIPAASFFVSPATPVLRYRKTRPVRFVILFSLWIAMPAASVMSFFFWARLAAVLSGKASYF